MSQVHLTHFFSLDSLFFSFLPYFYLIILLSQVSQVSQVKYKVYRVRVFFSKKKTLFKNGRVKLFFFDFI
jgi:hypothetical protein